MKARAALAALTLLVATALSILPTTPAEATCSADLSVCSQIKDANESDGDIYVYCQHAGWRTSYWIHPGQNSGCGRYAYAFEVYLVNTAVWCRRLGSGDAYDYWGGPGRYSISGTRSLSCLLVR